ncbi:MAG: hypothetical protein FJ115_00070 [Deltaproteobacteria bacterium]|nr:hypothetical protein [Deltaproteobacteria bacterium]MBM4321924.1 hypothetical protein [Deltaproteobacteria bacterium]
MGSPDVKRNNKLKEDRWPIKKPGGPPPKKKKKRGYTLAQSAILEASLQEIEINYESALWALPFVEIIGETPGKRWVGTKVQGEEEKDVVDCYDRPCMKLDDIETGNSNDAEPHLPDACESFFTYAFRKLEERFWPSQDYKLREKIEKNLEKWQAPDRLPPFTEMEPELRAWFSNIFEQFTGKMNPEREIDLSTRSEVDLIFFLKEDGQIDYRINLGFLDRLHIHSQYVAKKVHFPLSSRFSVTGPQLTQLIAARRRALRVMAKFLIQEQSEFLKAKDEDVAFTRLVPKNQSAFTQFANRNGLKIEKTRTTRVINNKWIRAPFSRSTWPLKIFFGEVAAKLNEKQDILMKAFEIHVIRGGRPALTAPDQTFILQQLWKKSEVNEQQIRKTLWPKIRKIYPKERWNDLRIAGGTGERSSNDHQTLISLVEEIKKELNW